MITGEIFETLALRKKMKISLNPVTEVIICLWFSLHIYINLNLQSQVGPKCNVCFPVEDLCEEPCAYPTSPPPPSYPTEMIEVSALGPHNSSPGTVLSGAAGGWWTSLCAGIHLKVSPASPSFPIQKVSPDASLPFSCPSGSIDPGVHLLSPNTLEPEEASYAPWALPSTLR